MEFDKWMETQVNCCTSCKSAYDAGREQGFIDANEKLIKRFTDAIKKLLENLNTHG